MKVICDIEANGLTPDRIFCVVCKEVTSGKVHVFLEHEQEKFKVFAAGVTLWIGHNFIDYDSHWLNRLWGAGIALDNIWDTLVLSRLFNRTWMQKTKEGDKLRQTRNRHRLQDWGEHFGYPKGDHDDFTKFTAEMLEYCKRDVELNFRVYKQLLEEGKDFSTFSIKLEQHQQWILSRQMRHGFKLDVAKATTLLAECKHKVAEIEAAIHRDFPPLPELVKEYSPPLTASGVHHLGRMGPLKDEYGFNYHGDPYSAIKWVPFNLRSPPQKVARLEGWWKPYVKTKSGKSWKVCEENLATLDPQAPQSIKNLAVHATLVSRVDAIQSWLDNLEDDGYVRGYIEHLGSWSGRMAHSGPNMANVPGVYDKQGRPQLVGKECRECWTVGQGNVLVGTDASGIQLRVLAHYLNNEEYTKAVLTDIHTFNAKILGCTRDVAKTFIYSWLLGAGVAKTAAILGCSIGEAVQKREEFVKLTPGLQEFMNEKQAAAARGYFRGLDGRIVYVPSNHLALTAYLQNGEGVVMRMANVLWDRWARQRGIQFGQCAMVHDEWQCEVEATRADEFGKLQEHAFVKAGEILKMNLPIAGESAIGRNWAETH
jgi:DNA polymerase-1